MRNTLIGVVSCAAMGAALLVATTPARADSSGPGPYGVGGPGTGKAVAQNGYWRRGPGYRGGYGYGYSYRGPTNGNAGPGPYGLGGPGTGKSVVSGYWGPGPGYGYGGPGPGYGYGYGSSGPGYAGYGGWGPGPSDGNSGPGPYGVGEPGTGKDVGPGAGPVYGGPYGY